MKLFLKLILIIISVIVFGFILLLFLLFFPWRSNKDYNYQTAKVDYEEGYMKARLLGTYKDPQKNLTVLGPPYELLVWFETNDETWDSIEIEEVELRNVQKSEITFNFSGSKLDEFKQSSLGSYYVTHSEFSNLNLEYDDYVLFVKFKLIKEGKNIEKEAELHFEKDYKEYRSNDFWSAMMGV